MRKTRKRPGAHPLVLELKKIRTSRGLTQQKVAEISGVSRYWLQDAELGYLNPSIHLLGYVAAAFGLQIALVPRGATKSTSSASLSNNKSEG